MALAPPVQAPATDESTAAALRGTGDADVEVGSVCPPEVTGNGSRKHTRTIAACVGGLLLLSLVWAAGWFSAQLHIGSQATTDSAKEMAPMLMLHATFWAPDLVFNDSSQWQVSFSDTFSNNATNQTLKLSAAQLVQDGNSTTFSFAFLPCDPCTVRLTVPVRSVRSGRLYGARAEFMWVSSQGHTYSKVLTTADSISTGQLFNLGSEHAQVAGPPQDSEAARFQFASGAGFKLVSLDTEEHVLATGEEDLLIPEVSLTVRNGHPSPRRMQDIGTPTGKYLQGRIRGYDLDVLTCGQSSAQHCDNMRLKVQSLATSPWTLLVTLLHEEGIRIGTFELNTNLSRASPAVRIDPAVGQAEQLLLLTAASELGAQLHTTMAKSARRLAALEKNKSLPVEAVALQHFEFFEDDQQPLAAATDMKVFFDVATDPATVFEEEEEEDGEPHYQGVGSGRRLLSPNTSTSVTCVLRLRDEAQLTDSKVIDELTEQWENITWMLLTDWEAQLEQDSAARREEEDEMVLEELQALLLTDGDLADMCSGSDCFDGGSMGPSTGPSAGPSTGPNGSLAAISGADDDEDSWEEGSEDVSWEEDSEEDRTAENFDDFGREENLEEDSQDEVFEEGLEDDFEDWEGDFEETEDDDEDGDEVGVDLNVVEASGNDTARRLGSACHYASSRSRSSRSSSSRSRTARSSSSRSRSSRSRTRRLGRPITRRSLHRRRRSVRPTIRRRRSRLARLRLRPRTQRRRRSSLSPSKLFETDYRFFRTTLLNHQIDVVGTATVSGKVSGVGSCPGAFGVKESTVRWKGAVKVDGTELMSVNPGLGRKVKKEQQFFRSCVPIKAARICIAIKGSIELHADARLQLKAWATGSIDLGLIEGGVRATGTLLDFQPRTRVCADTSRRWSGISVQAVYTMHPARFQLALVERHWEWRWKGWKLQLKKSRWNTILTLFDESWSSKGREFDLGNALTIPKRQLSRQSSALCR